MIPQPNLKTSRLVLRPFESSDIDRVADVANDEELSRNLRDVGWPYTRDDARRFIEPLAGDWEAGRSAVFAICLSRSAEQQLVGAIGLVFEQPSNRAEIGYWIGREYWGRGIATEASVSVLDFAFSEFRLHRVYAECLTRNPASAAVLKKVGMTEEGLLRGHFRKEETEEYCDVQLFGLLREAWNER